MGKTLAVSSKDLRLSSPKKLDMVAHLMLLWKAGVGDELLKLIGQLACPTKQELSVSPASRKVKGVHKHLTSLGLQKHIVACVHLHLYSVSEELLRG